MEAAPCRDDTGRLFACTRRGKFTSLHQTEVSPYAYCNSFLRSNISSSFDKISCT